MRTALIDIWINSTQRTWNLKKLVPYLKPNTASATASCRPTIGWNSLLAMRLAPASLVCMDSGDANLIWNTTQTAVFLLGRVTTWMLIAPVDSCSLVAITPNFLELFLFSVGLEPMNENCIQLVVGSFQLNSSTKVVHHLPAKGSLPRLPSLVWHQVLQLDTN